MKNCFPKTVPGPKELCWLIICRAPEASDKTTSIHEYSQTENNTASWYQAFNIYSSYDFKRTQVLRLVNNFILWEELLSWAVVESYQGLHR